jgi:YfiH family protein
VRVADCVPVLVGARTSGAVAAIHAGWRGVVAGVLGAALAALDGDAGRERERVAAIGPCIGPCCFEVGADVAESIARATDEPRVVTRVVGDKAFVDLRRAVRAQLAKAGVVDVEDVPGCTRCEPARFFSFRRDAAASGRHLAAIAVQSDPRRFP